MAAISQIIDVGAFLQATGLGMFAFWLTLIMKKDLKEFSHLDILFPLVVAVCVYVVQGIFNVSSSLGSKDLGRLHVKAPRMGPNSPLDFVVGRPISVGYGDIIVVLTWSTTDTQSKKFLSRMFKTYTTLFPKVVFAGISNENSDEIQDFLKREKISSTDIRIASNSNGDVIERLNTSHSITSVPHAFIINGTGRVEWHGHPSQLEPALTYVVKESKAPNSS